MRTGYLLVAGIVVAGALAAGGLDKKFGHGSEASAVPEPAAPAAAAPGHAATPPAADDATEVISGEVLETLEAGRYTYLRVGAKGSQGTWAAVPKAGIAVGQTVKVVNAVAMKDFKSETLKRTFETVYFGTIGRDGAPNDGTHAGMGAGNSPHGGDDDHAKNPHGNRPDVPADIKVGNVERAKGGKTVAEVWSKKGDLVGKKVTVRGVVVKRTNGVLNKNWLHIKDGSGAQAQGDDDLVVTTAENVELGQTVVIEGTVSADKDLGSGYKYPVLVEDAAVTKESK